MRKLNRKGFTLIELLAVIVIMAIIVVVTVPTIINTIEDARVNSIWNLAVSTANSYDTMRAQDILATDKILDGITVTGNWRCISPDLAEILNLSPNDIVLDDGKDDNDDTIRPTGNIPTISQKTCSAIKLKSNGNAEVILVASNDYRSKFKIANKVVYAFSSNSSGSQKDA